MATMFSVDQIDETFLYIYIYTYIYIYIRTEQCFIFIELKPKHIISGHLYSIHTGKPIPTYVALI